MKDIIKNPADYELIVIGTPNWNSNMSVPVRTYLTENHSKFNNVAFMCTATRNNGFDKLFADMEEVSKTVPLSTIGIDKKELKSGSYKVELEEFITKLK